MNKDFGQALRQNPCSCDKQRVKDFSRRCLPFHERTSTHCYSPIIDECKRSLQDDIICVKACKGPWDHPRAAHLERLYLEIESRLRDMEINKNFLKNRLDE